MCYNHNIDCRICNKSFKYNKHKSSKYCSTACYRAAQQRGDYIGTKIKSYRNCLCCDKPTLGKKLKYCDKICYLSYVSQRKSDKSKRCLECEQLFIPNSNKSKYCSMDCRLLGLKNEPCTCKNCKVVFSSVKYSSITGKYISSKNATCSSKCHIEWISNNQQRKDKLSKAFKGSKHPNWLGGISHDHNGRRGVNWSTQRLKAIKRDGEVCICCGLTRSQHRDLYNSDLEVNHIIPFRNFLNHKEANNLKNLETLCKKCHGKREARKNVQIVMDFYELRKGERC